jgi:hypothetical protein
MKLKLCFTDDGNSHRPLTGYEINELGAAAQAISAIARVMGEYVCDCSSEEENHGIFISMFTVLEWLIEPVVDYLDEYAGDPAAPEDAGHAG